MMMVMSLGVALHLHVQGILCPECLKHLPLHAFVNEFVDIQNEGILHVHMQPSKAYLGTVIDVACSSQHGCMCAWSALKQPQCM